MLQNASDIKGYKIIASDGALGSVSDFLFDDASWRVRWLVVDTGNWLPGRRVLLPPSVLGHLDDAAQTFSVRLTRAQIKDSPDISADQPVSRQVESDVYEYYGWNPYWSTGLSLGGYGGMMSPYGMPADGPLADEHYENVDHQGDTHLRSAAAVQGYHLHATDGDIGHVADFLIEDLDWSIIYLVADTTNWWPGKKVLIAPTLVQSITWSDSKVVLAVTRQAVRDSPPYDPTKPVDTAALRAYRAYYRPFAPRAEPGRPGAQNGTLPRL